MISRIPSFVRCLLTVLARLASDHTASTSGIPARSRTRLTASYTSWLGPLYSFSASAFIRYRSAIRTNGYGYRITRCQALDCDSGCTSFCTPMPVVTQAVALLYDLFPPSDPFKL